MIGLLDGLWHLYGAYPLATGLNTRLRANAGEEAIFDRAFADPTGWATHSREKRRSLESAPDLPSGYLASRERR